MAVQATLVQPVPDFITVENLAGLPSGRLITPYVMTTAVDFTVDFIISGRFPTPAAALGFLIDVYDEEGDPIYGVGGLASPYIFTGAVYPESDFLEPTQGQIWPRIG